MPRPESRLSALQEQPVIGAVIVEYMVEVTRRPLGQTYQNLLIVLQGPV